MNIAEISIKYKTITLVMVALIIGGGIYSYKKLGRLEDPEFTIKDAQIFTLYPGATAQEVAEDLVSAGVKAILNYAPINLSVPENVRVQYIDPVIHLQRMTYYL